MTRSKYGNGPKTNRMVPAGDVLLKPSRRARPGLRQMVECLGLAGLVCGLSFSSSAQQVIQGEAWQADGHAVVNFRGLAELERLYGLGTNGVQRAVHAPYPLGRMTNNPPGPRSAAVPSASAEKGFTLAAAPPLPPSPPPTASFQALLD